MVRVPTYQRQVATPRPQPLLEQATATPATFGAQQAQAIGQAGAQVQQSALQVGAIFADIRARRDDKEARDAESEYNKRLDEIMLRGEKPFYGRQGKQAADGVDELSGELKRISGEVSASLNPRSAEIFQRVVSRRNDAVSSDYARYALGQLQKHDEIQQAALRQEAVDAVAAHPESDDAWVRVADALEWMERKDEDGNYRSGKSAEEIRVEQAQLRAQTAQAAINAYLVRDEPGKAQELLDKAVEQETIPGTVATGLQERIKNADRRIRVATAVAEIHAKYRDDVDGLAKGLKEARKLPAQIRDDVARGFEQEVNADRRAEAYRTNRLVYTVEQRIGDLPANDFAAMRKVAADADLPPEGRIYMEQRIAALESGQNANVTDENTVQTNFLTERIDEGAFDTDSEEGTGLERLMAEASASRLTPGQKHALASILRSRGMAMQKAAAGSGSGTGGRRQAAPEFYSASKFDTLLRSVYQNAVGTPNIPPSIRDNRLPLLAHINSYIQTHGLDQDQAEAYVLRMLSFGDDDGLTGLAMAATRDALDVGRASGLEIDTDSMAPLLRERYEQVAGGLNRTLQQEEIRTAELNEANIWAYKNVVDRGPAVMSELTQILDKAKVPREPYAYVWAYESYLKQAELTAREAEQEEMRRIEEEQRPLIEMIQAAEAEEARLAGIDTTAGEALEQVTLALGRTGSRETGDPTWIRPSTAAQARAFRNVSEIATSLWERGRPGESHIARPGGVLSEPQPRQEYSAIRSNLIEAMKLAPGSEEADRRIQAAATAAGVPVDDVRRAMEDMRARSAGRVLSEIEPPTMTVEQALELGIEDAAQHPPGHPTYETIVRNLTASVGVSRNYIEALIAQRRR